MERFENILVHVESDGNEDAINRAVELAIVNNASLTLIDVVRPIPRAIGMLTDVAKPAELEKLVAKDRRNKLLAIDSVADEIEADLLVIGTVCRTGFAGFLIGGTAESVVSNVTCSLLTLKPDGFCSPIKMSHFTNCDSPEELPQL